MLQDSQVLQSWQAQLDFPSEVLRHPPFLRFGSEERNASAMMTMSIASMIQLARFMLGLLAFRIARGHGPEQSEQNERYEHEGHDRADAERARDHKISDLEDDERQRVCPAALPSDGSPEPFVETAHFALDSAHGGEAGSAEELERHERERGDGNGGGRTSGDCE